MGWITLSLYFFFFQAEDGIRDHCVTGVQTCALPILLTTESMEECWVAGDPTRLHQLFGNLLSNAMKFTPPGGDVTVALRSEERRVGKECRSGWAADR